MNPTTCHPYLIQCTLFAASIERFLTIHGSLWQSKKMFVNKINGDTKSTKPVARSVEANKSIIILFSVTIISRISPIFRVISNYWSNNNRKLVRKLRSGGFIDSLYTNRPAPPVLICFDCIDCTVTVTAVMAKRQHICVCRGHRFLAHPALEEATGLRIDWRSNQQPKRTVPVGLNHPVVAVAQMLQNEEEKKP